MIIKFFSMNRIIKNKNKVGIQAKYLCLFIFLCLYNISISVSANLNELIITYRLDSAPIQFQNKNGEADGILIDFWKLWSKKSGIPVSFKGAYNQQSQEMIINGKADINAGIFANKSRSEYLKFSEPILNSSYHLFVQKTLSQTISLQRLQGFGVGVTRGSFHEAYMRKNYPDVELFLYDGYQKLFNAAERGDVRVFISQSMYRTYFLRQHSLIENYRMIDLPLYTHSYKAAVNKNSTELLRTINTSMAKIEEVEKADITRRWLGLQWHTKKNDKYKKIKLTDNEKNWISKHKIIRMGGESDWPPFDYADEKGDYQGIASDYVKLLEDRLGLKIKMYYKQPWAETLNMFKAGKLDAIVAISKTVEREKYARFTTPYATYPYVIITNEKNTQLSKLHLLSGKQVAVEKNFYTHRTLLSQFPDINLIVEDSTENAILAVVQGRADAYVGVQPVASYFLEKNLITNLRTSGITTIDKVGISMATQTDAAILLQLLQKGLDSITTAEKLAIQRKWLGITTGSSNLNKVIKLSNKQKKWITSQESIRIGVDPSWPPIEYIDKKGVYSGIASDYIGEFERAFSVKVDYDSTLKWNDVVKGIKSGKIDILPAVSKTLEREKYLNFTDPYLKFPYVIFTRSDAEIITGLNELINKTIVVEKNYANFDILTKHHPEIKLLLVDNTEEALSAIALGNADAYMGNLAATSHIILQTGITNIKVAAPTPYSNDLAFAVRKDLPELVEISQLFLDSITVEQANAFKKKWFSINYEHNVDYSLVWKIVAFSVFILFIISLWLWMLNRQKESLRISEERFRLIMNATQEGIWDWDIELNNVYYSPGFYNILGYSESEFTEKCAAWMDLLHPDDYKEASESFNKIIINCVERYSLEFRLKHKNGLYRDVVATGSLVLNKKREAVRSLGSLVDITEKKSINKKLKQNEVQLKRIVDTIPLAIIISDDDGQIIFSNKQTEKEIGSDQSVIGINIGVFYEKYEDRERLFSLYREKGVVDSLPMRFKTLSGEITEGIISMLPVYFDGKMRNLGVLVNLTERIQMERELIAAKIQADIANKTKSSFLANMSHEIRTPMNAIIGLGHLVLKTSLNERQQDYIEKIQSSSHSLLGIINDILDFSKIEAGKLEIEKIEFKLEDVIENISSLVALKAEEKNLEVLFSIDPDVPVSLIGDPLRLGQILINLTQNAIKFTDQGEVLIKIIQLEKIDNKSRLELSVTDTGIGISEGHISHLFDAFSQVDETYTRRFEGTGLGLAICKQLVDLMGGDIAVKSTLDEGSTFSFQLKFEVAESNPKKPINISFKGKRALVVDDNSTARQVLTSMLESFCFNVQSVSSGQAAIDVIAKSAGIKNQHFDLVLLDWKMPGLNGIETSQKIYKDIDQPHIPTIIMVTSYGREEIIHQSEQVGLDAFLIKPINSSLLFNTIVQAMQGTVINQKQTPKKISSKQLSGRILLVEDNKINQQVARETLGNMGLSVHVVNNGMEALDILEDNNFDVVLTDIQMPGMDGYELTRQIRLHKKYQYLPIVAMTAHAMVKDREKCLDAGMNDHLPKPIDPEQLFKTLSNWLNLIKTKKSVEDDSDDEFIKLPTEISGIDINWGLKRIGGNKKLFCKLLREFFQDYADAGEKVDIALKEVDLELVRRLVHTIQGIAGSIGAINLLKASEDMDSVLKNKNIPDSAVQDAFVDALAEVINALKTWLGEGELLRIDESVQNVFLDENVLSHINQLLKTGDSKAEVLISRINTNDLESETTEIISTLLNSARNYDFMNAQSVLSKLREKIKA